MAGINYKRHFLVEYLGFNMEYEKMRIGRYLQLKLIHDIAQTKCADFLDFGFGGDSYKRELSSQKDEDIRIKIYSPKFSNIFFTITITIFSYLNSWTRLLLKKTMLYEKIRKIIRIIFARQRK